MQNTQVTQILFDWNIKSVLSLYDIKKRYYEMSHIHHPDKGGDTVKFDTLKKEYNILLDEFNKIVPENEKELLEKIKPIGYYYGAGEAIPIIDSKGNNGKYYITNNNLTQLCN